jgi:glycosyltransferase involved in cell wall biosynthesis
MKLLAIPNDATRAYERNYKDDFLSEFNPLYRNSQRFFDEVKFLNWKDEVPDELFGIGSIPILEDKERAMEILKELSKNEREFETPLFGPLFEKEIKSVDGFMKEYKPDVVRAFNSHFAGELGSMIKDKYDVPLVISAHDPSRLTKIVEEADSLVCISENLKDICLERYNIDESKVKVIPDGIDMSFFYPRKNPNVDFDGKYKILSVGRIVPSKNIEKLLESIKYVKEELGKDIKHLHIGKGSEENVRNIEKLRDDFGLNGISYFLGGIHKTKLPEFYSWADVYSLPTLWEGLGRAQIESLACGTPVLTTNLPPMNNIVEDGYNGFTFDPNDSEDIAKKTINYFKNNELRKYMEKNARESVRGKYGVDRVMKLNSENYKELIGR